MAGRVPAIHRDADADVGADYARQRCCDFNGAIRYHAFVCSHSFMP